MRPFVYARPESLADVCALLAEHGRHARLLAGGTDLIVRMRRGQWTPRVVVDLKRVHLLRAEITETDGVLNVGARTVMTDLINDRRVRRHFSALAEAAAVVGSVQIRNRATLAGNICNASPAADTVPALLVYGASVNLIGTNGSRRLPLNDFLLGPGKTLLRTDEIVESIDLPFSRENHGSAFARVARRYGVDLATVNVACLITSSGVTRFAFGAAGPRVVLVEDLTGILVSPSSDPQGLNFALDRLIEHTAPRTDLRGGRDYRLAMLRVMGLRALNAAGERLQMTSGIAE